MMLVLTVIIHFGITQNTGRSTDAHTNKFAEGGQRVHSDIQKSKLINALSNYQYNDCFKNPKWTLGISRNDKKIIEMLDTACIYKCIQNLSIRIHFRMIQWNLNRVIINRDTPLSGGELWKIR